MNATASPTRRDSSRLLDRHVWTAELDRFRRQRAGDFDRQLDDALGNW